MHWIVLFLCREFQFSNLYRKYNVDLSRNNEWISSPLFKIFSRIGEIIHRELYDINRKQFERK